MRRWGLMPLTLAAAAMLALAIPSIAVAEKATADAGTVLPAEPVGKVRPAGCLPAQPLTCAGMPTPVGATCSCSSSLLDVPCRTCESGEHGQVMSTTCTVMKPCTNPPCDFDSGYSRTGYSCSS